MNLTIIYWLILDSQIKAYMHISLAKLTKIAFKKSLVKNDYFNFMVI